MRLSNAEVLRRLEEVGFSPGETFMYTAMRRPIDVYCHCGHRTAMRLDHIQEVGACAACNNPRLTHKEVKAYFESQNCVLLTTHYVNNKQPLEYICQCGRRHTANYNVFKLGSRCGQCWRSKHPTFEELALHFESNGLVLLDYDRPNKPVKFQCGCGRQDTVVPTADTIWLSRICRFCKAETVDWRKSYACVLWREAVYEKFNYECQLCGSEDRINAHHIESAHANEHLRLNLDNGIVLCYDCHTKFHYKYGYFNNTRVQLQAFMEGSNAES